MEMSLEGSEYVDWGGRSAQKGEHGGKKGAVIVCLVEILENMVFIANASNLVIYFHSYMNFSIPKSSTMLANFMGTCFILTLLGGFIADSFLKRFWSIIISAFAELLGLILLTTQAIKPSLHPGLNEKASSSQATMLYFGLYLVAVGVGGIKGSLAAHGADQLDDGGHDDAGERTVTSFFNWFFFSLCTGGMLAVTFLVWIQMNKGWKMGLILCTSFLFVAILLFASGFKCYRYKVPSGSPFTRIFKVLILSVRNRNAIVGTSPCLVQEEVSQKKFRFLEKAKVGGNASTQQVEEARSFLRLLPIFASTIVMNCCLAQLQTFSVQQGETMNTNLTATFKIPTASLTAIPLVVMLISVPTYDRLTSPATKKLTGINFTLKPLQRIGIGLLLASVSMSAAAIVELRRRESSKMGKTMSVFWLGWQFLLLGVSDMFTLAGMMEFFYSQAPHTMRSMCTSMAWGSTAMGYFLSSVLVDVVNAASRRNGAAGWLTNSLDESRLELFYAIVAVLNFINFLIYLAWAKWY